MNVRFQRWPTFVLCTLVLGCGRETVVTSPRMELNRFADAAWSEPVNLGPVVNSDAADMNAGLGASEHDLYLVSTRAGGFGNNDIWVSHRQCITCPWEAPVNVGAPINTAAQEGAPTFSEDGKLFFFFSAKPGGAGLQDLYVSQRVSTSSAGDVWGDPINLGPLANTANAEQGVYYVREGPARALYFNRIVGATGNQDIYRVEVDNDGMPISAAVIVPELNDAVGADQKVAVRTDGKELLISSTRTGGAGGQDLWVSFRATHHETWSIPVNLGAPVNTAGGESQPTLSRDGRTMIITSARPGGSGMNDLWMTTRAAGGN